MTFWSLTNSYFPTNQTFHQFHDLDTKLDLHRLWVVSMDHLQRVWYASRERLPFRTPGSVPPLWDLLVFQLLRPDSSNLPCLYSTFRLEYPFLLSRFCLVNYKTIVNQFHIKMMWELKLGISRREQGWGLDRLRFTSAISTLLYYLLVSLID